MNGILRLSALGVALLLVACGDSLTDNQLVIPGTGVVAGFAFIDVDGSGSPGGADQPAEGIRLRLLPAGGGGAVTSATTDADGIFVMEAVPVGGFRLEVDPTTVPDSVEVLGLDGGSFILADGDTIERNFRLSFPTYDLAEVRELDPGQRVFTHGIVLNSRVTFGDGVVHLREGPVFLRGTEVERVTIAPGDSVRFSGRTAVDAGQPILTDVRVFMLQPQAVPPPTPIEMTGAQAATADGGTRDAALARIRNAVIQDTVRVGDDLIVTVDDGSEPVDVVLRAFISWNWSAFEPETREFTQVAGLLIPVMDGTGEVRWRLNPRGGGDVTLGTVASNGSGAAYARPATLSNP